MIDPPTSPLATAMDTYRYRLAEMAFEPGLVAAVDQHAAAVREALNGIHRRLEHPPLDPELLGDYLVGFHDALAERGWRASDEHDFAALRFTAICWLAQVEGMFG